MAQPKSRTSKQRKRKRRTHYKATNPQIQSCKKTGEPHVRHHAYWHEGNMYYRGQLVIKAQVEEV